MNNLKYQHYMHGRGTSIIIIYIISIIIIIL